jgi:hypothetical protein
LILAFLVAALGSVHEEPARISGAVKRPSPTKGILLGNKLLRNFISSNGASETLFGVNNYRHSTLAKPEQLLFLGVDREWF